MTKPVIVNRVTKGSPLTTTEHDANFTNLQNATVGLRAGSAGTTVTADLNGVITLVAGSGVTFTGDDTAKTITVTATASDILGTNDITIGSDTGTDTVLRSEANSLTIRSGESGVFGNDEVTSLTLTPTGGITLQSTAADGTILLKSRVVKLSPMTNETGTFPSVLQLGYGTATSDVREEGQIYYDDSLNLVRYWNGSVWAFLVSSEGNVSNLLEAGAFTTAERDALSPQPANGVLIYNSSTNSLQLKNVASSDTNDWSNVVTTGVLNESINVKGWTIGNSSNVANYSSTVYGNYNLVLSPEGFSGAKLTLTAIDSNIKLSLVNGGGTTGVVEFTSTSGTPGNTTTPTSWLKVAVGGTSSFYYLPLYS